MSNMSPYTLNQSQIDQFHEHGYLLLKVSKHKLVDPGTLQQWTSEVRNWPKVNGKWMPYYEVISTGEKQLMRTEKFVDYHDEFEHLLCGADLRNILGQLSGDVCFLVIKDNIRP